jgi:Tol biopolymer transport system component
VVSAAPDARPYQVVVEHGRQRSRLRRVFAWSAAAIAVACVVAALGWVLRDRPAMEGSAGVPSARQTRLTNVGTVVRAAISPDGRSLAYAASTGARESLWMKDIGSGAPVQLREPDVGTYRRGGGLSYAPNGWVYYTWFRPDLSAVGVYRIPERGGAPERLVNVWDLPSFAPGGDRFACISTTSSSIRESRLLVYDAAGGSPQVLAIRTPPMSFIQMRPAWSPDGRRLAAWSMNEQAPGMRDLIVVDVQDHRERVVTSVPFSAVDGMIWLPDGGSLIVSARERVSSPLRLWKIPLAAPVMRPVTTDTSDYLLAGLAGEGQQLAAVRVDVARTLWVAPTDDIARGRPIASDAGELSELESIAWTPDGGVLYTSAESGNADIWMADPVSGTRRQLTTHPGDDFNPASSPDGQAIVFASDRSGSTGLWTMSYAGETSVRQLTSGGDSRPSISAGSVVFQRGLIQSAPITLWRMPIAGGTPVQITGGVDIRPAASPDGALVAHYWLTTERWVLAVVPVTGGKPLQVFPLSPTHCGRTVRWSADGKSLAYIDCEGGAANIWRQRLDGSPPQKLTNFTSGHIETFDWSRDGSQLAWVTRNQVSDAVLIDVPGSVLPAARAPVRARDSAVVAPGGE